MGQATSRLRAAAVAAVAAAAQRREAAEAAEAQRKQEEEDRRRAEEAELRRQLTECREFLQNMKREKEEVIRDRERLREEKTELLIENQRQNALHANHKLLDAYNSKIRLLEQSLTEKKQEMNAAVQKKGELHHKIQVEEEEIKHFEVERNDKNCRVLHTCGITGHGKSTFCNRFCGDTSEDGDEGHFKVGEDWTSETTEIKKKIVEINGVTFAIVDTPGAHDSEHRDGFFVNQMVKFLRGCGGVTAFLIFFHLCESRVSSVYQNLLKDYERLLGRDFWDFVVIIATKTDMVKPEKREKKLESLAKQISKVMRLDFVLPCVGFGKDDYEESLEALVRTLTMVAVRYRCDAIVSPIDDMRREEESLAQQIEMLLQKILAIEGQMREISTAKEEVQNRIAELGNKVKSKEDRDKSEGETPGNVNRKN